MEDGVWRTIGGRRIFIKKGKSVEDAVRESGKFRSAKDVEHQKRKIANDISKGMYIGKEREEKWKEYDALDNTEKKETKNSENISRLPNKVSSYKSKNQIEHEKNKIANDISLGNYVGKEREEKWKEYDSLNNLSKMYDKGESYRDKVKSIGTKEDGTYNLGSGTSVSFGNKGYNVSFEQSSDNYTNAEYYLKIQECKNKCDGKVYVGVFGGDAEISFYTTDLKTAKEIMYKYNQHSIWSNELGDIIMNDRYDENKNKVNYKGE